MSTIALGLAAVNTQLAVEAEGKFRPSFLDSYYNQIKQTGWAYTNRWLVLLYPNANVTKGIGYNVLHDATRLALTCKSITMNDQSWYTSEQSYLNAGPSRIMPYKRNTTNTGGIKIQWNLGADMFEKEFFDEWMRYIQNPYTRAMNYYDDYAKGSVIYLILIPNHVRNFFEAVEAIQQGKLVGYHLQEVYPYSTNINGGALNYTTSQEPMFVDVGFMYRDIVPLYGGYNIRSRPAIPFITDTGFPAEIPQDRYKDILAASQRGLDTAVDGFAIGTIAERAAFNSLRENQHAILRQYTQQLQEFRNTDFPRAVDGRVVYSTPKQGALDLGLSVLQDTQAFLGAGFFGNGFYP